jgi:galactokinase
MAQPKECIYLIQYGKLNDLLASLYGEDAAIDQTKRYIELIRKHEYHFPGHEMHLFSTPGRTELGGNHTDHNNGRVLAASVQLDALAAVSPSNTMSVELYSEGYPDPFLVNLNDLSPMEAEEGHTESLIRGIAARFVELGYRIGGFRGYIDSHVMPGSGLSSSAAIEVLIGTIFNHLHNDGTISKILLAQIGQYAENTFFKKPCGLMDQVACASGGIVAIDFSDPASPQVDRVTYNFAKAGYSLMVVDTGGSHADLTAEYASVPDEMRRLAQALGEESCRGVTTEALFQSIRTLRREVGDRAVLRALHFMEENRRVERQTEALRRHRTEDYLSLVRQSGDSSWRLLQNCYPSGAVQEQPVALGLAITEDFLQGHGAFRVHGGGFAGTIQAYVPHEVTQDYIQAMEWIYGEGCVTPLRIRQEETMQII